MGRVSSLKGWVLSQEAFDKLLACLHPDRDRAAEKYEATRQKLITFFEIRGSLSPEDHADETINRVARKLEEGKEIYASDALIYFYGVARNVLKEHWDRPGRDSDSMDDLASGKGPFQDPELAKEEEAARLLLERRLECLEQCLQKLPRETRELITDYYQGDKGIKVKNRNRLAEKLGMPLNALRIKACRLRAKLEDCVKGCLKESAES